MTRAAFVLLAVAASALASDDDEPPTTFPCFWNSGRGATFDLEPFAGAGGIEVTDNRNVPEDNKLWYRFAICDDVDPIPYPERCRVTVGADGKNSSGPSPAFQYFQPRNASGKTFSNVGDDPHCWRLADTTTNTNNHEWDFLWGPDTHDPAEGVSLKYLNGDSCKTDDGKFMKRAITLHFVCEPTSGHMINENVTVEEDTLCDYHVFIKTRYGCPVECPIARRPDSYLTAVCAGHGVCGYDDTNQAAKCFCNKGFGGDDCSQKVSADKASKKNSSGPSGGKIFGALFGGVILGLVLAGAAYYYVVVVRGGGSSPQGRQYGNFDDEEQQHGGIPGIRPSGYAAPRAGAGDDDEGPML